MPSPYRYDANFGAKIAKAGGGFLLVPPITWQDIDDAGLAGLLGAAAAVEREISLRAGKTGPDAIMTIYLTSKVVPLNGGPIPAGSIKPSITYSGLTQQDIVDIQSGLIAIGLQMIGWGQALIDQKKAAGK